MGGKFAAVAQEKPDDTLELKDGRTLAGIVRNQSPQAVVLAMIGETITVNRSDITEEITAARSAMPDGQLDALTDTWAIDMMGSPMNSAPPPANQAE